VPPRGCLESSWADARPSPSRRCVLKLIDHRIDVCMNNSDFDIHQFVLLDHDSLGFPEGHARALQLFRASVVTPSLREIDREIEENARSEEPGSEFFESDLADLFQATVEGYLLTVQSMWERGLRRLLANRERRLCGGAEVNTLQKALWSSGPKSLQSHFERLVAVPLTSFDSYGDLDLLQNLGNAIRHGDGPSAERVHNLAPTLWWNWIGPGKTILAGPLTIVTPADGPSFDNVTLKEVVLEQMIQSIAAFWEDLECMRCNSFRNKHESVVRKLEAWPDERQRRRSTRVWMAS
jgi:hypothetical protein